MTKFDYKLTAFLTYRHAQDFRKSAEFLHDNISTRVVMVNISFACELYMKALLIWNSKCDSIIREHLLNELFEKLDKNTQMQIKTESGIKNWDEFITHSSDAFRDWRYYYEKDNIMFGDIGGLFAFAESLDKICKDTIPLKEVISK